MNHLQSNQSWLDSTHKSHLGLKSEQNSSQIAKILVVLLFVGAYGLFTIGFLNFNANIGIFIALAAITYLISLIDPRYGLAAVVIGFSLSPDIAVGNGINLRLEDFLIPAVGICWFLKNLGSREDLAFTLHKRPFLLMVGLGLISTSLGLLNGKLTFVAACTYYFKSIEYIFLFFIAINIMKTRQDIKFILITLFFASTFVGFYGLYQALAFGQSFGYRVSGPDGETANILGGYYVFCVLLSFGILFCAKSLRIKILIMSFLLIPMFWPLIQTFSRASFVSLLAALTVIGFLTKQRILVWVALIMIMIPILFPEDVYSRLRTVLGIFSLGGEEMPSSFQDKIYGWRSYWYTNFSKYPILGTGVGSISLNIDNEYFKILGETGVLGIFCFGWMIMISYQLGFKIYKKSSDHLAQGIALGYLGAITALLLQGISGTVFTTMRTMEPFILITAIITVLNNIYEQNKSHHFSKTSLSESIPAIGRYTITEVFRERYRKQKPSSTS